MVVPSAGEAVKVGMLVPADQAGKIIGKGGSGFQVLRDLGCDITMHQVTDSEGFRRAELKGASGEHLAVGFQAIASRLGRGEEHSLFVVVNMEQAAVLEENQGDKMICDMAGVQAAVDWGWVGEEAERRVSMQGRSEYLGHAFRLLLSSCGVDGVAEGNCPRPRRAGIPRANPERPLIGGRPATVLSAGEPATFAPAAASHVGAKTFLPPDAFEEEAFEPTPSLVPTAPKTFAPPDSFEAACEAASFVPPSRVLLPPEEFAATQMLMPPDAYGGAAQPFMSPDQFEAASAPAFQPPEFQPPEVFGAAGSFMPPDAHAARVAAPAPSRPPGGYRRENQEAEVHFVATDSQVEAISGWQGSSLRNVEQQSGCRAITVLPTADGILSEVCMQGSIASVIAAFRLLWDMLGQFGEAVPAMVTMIYVAPRGRVGAVVGKQGSGLKQVREATRLEVKVVQDPEEGWGRCTFSGAVQSALDAAEMLHLLSCGIGGGKVTLGDLVHSRAALAGDEEVDIGALGMQVSAGAHAVPAELVEIVQQAKAAQAAAAAQAQAQAQAAYQTGSFGSFGSRHAEPEPLAKRQKLMPTSTGPPQMQPPGAVSLPSSFAAQAAAVQEDPAHRQLLYPKGKQAQPPAQQFVPAPEEPARIALLVPQEDAGKVVGKGGAVFQLLREIGADMTLHQQPDAENFRRADLKGQTVDHLEEGFALILQRLLGTRNRYASVVLAAAADKTEIFECHPEHYAQAIKEITGVTITVEYDPSGEVVERRVRMEGDPSRMGEALRLLLGLTLDGAAEGFPTVYS